MNRLAGSTSPYLRQHADNPVDWWPWIPEAFAEAKRRNVPVHLSIGYAACHWCHVMARESFSDPATAELLNRDFVSIKVDREERPEVDQIYMRALHALGEQGGWPLTMFLTPDAEPFWGGTYFPPEPRYGRPSFRQILGARLRRLDVRRRGGHEERRVAPRASEPARRAAGRRRPSRRCSTARRRRSSPSGTCERGSFKGAPKFPNPLVLEVLWRAFRRTGDAQYRAAVLDDADLSLPGRHLRSRRRRLRPLLGRRRWLVPHFEKMLYDNGLLLSALALSPTGDDAPSVSGANRRDGRLAPARDAASRRRLRLEPRRRHRA